MDDSEVLAASASLRRQLADWLETLTPEQVATDSLCAGWRVREVAAHLLTAVAVPAPRFLGRVVRSGFSLDRAMDHFAHRLGQQDVADLAASLRARADVPFAPPGLGPRAPLTDLLVHDGDMRVPLGLPLREHPVRTAVALDFLASTPRGLVPRGRLDGLRFVASDGSGSWGDAGGAEVTGAPADLLMVAAGRGALLDRVGGPGAGVLAGRL